MKSLMARVVATVVGLTFLYLSAVLVSADEMRTVRTGVPEIAARLTRIELLPATNRLQLAIGLPLRDQPALVNLFRQLYDPASTNFHHFLTPPQFTERFGPTEHDYQRVTMAPPRTGLTNIRSRP